MTKTLPISKAREELPTLVNNAKKRLDEYIITVKGEPAAVILSHDEYESLLETNAILADEGLMKAIRQGEKELDEGRGIPWEDVKEELGLDQ